MIAAIYNHKEALLQLLAPFITSGDAAKIERLVHHTNARGQRLLGVNFINILRAPFSYESALHSFSPLTFCLCNFWQKNVGEKAACKMLMKLTSGLVVHHRQNLLVAHGILVEFEALAHGWDSRKVKACFRDILGSTAGAADTLHIFEKIDKKEGSSLLFSQFLTFVKIFSFAFLFRFKFQQIFLILIIHKR